jgi:hypothetical protein
MGARMGTKGFQKGGDVTIQSRDTRLEMTLLPATWLLMGDLSQWGSSVDSRGGSLQVQRPEATAGRCHGPRRQPAGGRSTK